MSPLPQEPPGARRGVGRLVPLPGRSQQGLLLAGAALAASLLCALAASAGVIPGEPAAERRAQGHDPGANVRLGGHVVGLFPGSVRRLQVRVENLGRRPVTVRSVRALVGDPSRRCQAGNVRVSAFRGSFRLAPHRRRSVRLRIAMRTDAANACQRARFPLTYRATLGR